MSGPQLSGPGPASGSGTLPSSGGSLSLSGPFRLTANGALSTGAGPAGQASGTWITGGDTTTTKPYVLIEPAGTTSNAWNTNGTSIGVNAAAGFTGNLVDLQLAATSKFKVNYAGAVTVPVAGSYIVSTVSALYPGSSTIGITVSSARAIAWASTTDPTSGTYDVTISRQGAGIMQIGTTTTNALGAILANAFVAGGTVPAVSSGTINAASKNNAGTISSLTTGAYSGIITFTFTAPTGWRVFAINQNAGTAIVQTASSTTTATIGGATTSGDIIGYIAFPY